MPNPPHLLSVNVGVPRTVRWAGRAVTSAIWKSPASGPVCVAGVNLDGDDQADRWVHGGPDKAVYAYAAQDYRWWSKELGIDVPPGTFGENLTTEGLDLGAALIGRRWTIGTATFEVAQPRQPCFKLGMRMGDAAFVDRFAASGRTGAYLRIVVPGEISAGDVITEGEPPEHGLTIRELANFDRSSSPATLARVASVGAVPEPMRTRAREQLEKQRPSG